MPELDPGIHDERRFNTDHRRLESLSIFSTKGCDAIIPLAVLGAALNANAMSEGGRVMKFPTLRDSLLRTICKVAIMAAVAGLAGPRESHAAGRCLNYCAQLCPQYLAQYCVVYSNGDRKTIWTNPCFACHADYCVLYLGQCKPIIPIPPRCKGPKCPPAQ
jgi:hypothetical protein